MRVDNDICVYGGGGECVRACARVCVRACVLCVRARARGVCVCVCVGGGDGDSAVAGVTHVRVIGLLAKAHFQSRRHHLFACMQHVSKLRHSFVSQVSC